MLLLITAQNWVISSFSSSIQESENLDKISQYKWQGWKNLNWMNVRIIRLWGCTALKTGIIMVGITAWSLKQFCKQWCCIHKVKNLMYSKIHKHHGLFYSGQSWSRQLCVGLNGLSGNHWHHVLQSKKDRGCSDCLKSSTCDYTEAHEQHEQFVNLQRSH